MFCPNCGTQNDENVAFCKNCGTKLADSQPVNDQNAAAQQPEAQPQPQVQSSVNYAAPIMRVKPVRSSHPVINAIKEIGASPLFIVAVITFSCALLFSILNLFTKSSGVLYSIEGILNRLGISNLNSILWRINQFSIVSGFIALIPTMLYTVGLWLVFAAAQNRNNNGMSTSGLTMIKVLEIIALIFTCIGLAVVEIVCVFGIIMASNPNIYGYDYGNDYMPAISTYASIILVAVAIGALIGFILAIVYHAKIISTINTVKSAIITGKADYKVSGFVAVMNFILAFFAVFGLFSGGFFNFLSGVCSVTALICFGVLIFKYRSAMIKTLSPDVKAASGFAQTYTQV